MPRLPVENFEQRVFQAVEELLKNDATFSMSQLAKTAGISRATIYRTYQNRTVLLQDYAQKRGVDVEELLTAALRERILDAVGETIRTKGLVATTIDHVAQQARVGQATVFRKFGDRHSLLEAFFAERTPKLLANRLAHASASDDDVERDLTKLAREILEFFWHYRDFMYLILSPNAEARELLHNVRQRVGSTREGVFLYIRRQVEAKRLVGDAAKISAIFFGILFALAMSDSEIGANTETHPKQKTSEIDLDAMAQFAVRSLLFGHRVGGAEASTLSRPDAKETDQKETTS